jgi:hypothetical protein
MHLQTLCDIKMMMMIIIIIIIIYYIFKSNWVDTVAVVQYTFKLKQYIEQHNSLIKKSVDCAPYLRGIPWHLPYN